MEVSLLLDIVLALLLAATIAAAVVLHRRLGSIRSDRERFEIMAVSFDEATSRAEDGIGRLKLASDELARLCAEADSLKDDLKYLVERAGTAADRLEGCVRAARQTDGRPASGPASGPLAPATTKDAVAGGATDRIGARSVKRARRSEVERNLLKALGMADKPVKKSSEMSQI